MNLSGKSGYEINVMLAKIKYGNLLYEIIDIHGTDSIQITHFPSEEDCDLRLTDALDWCNDDALAFRLMIDSDINMNEGIASSSEHPWIKSSHENPNRRVSECKILMSQEASK